MAVLRRCVFAVLTVALAGCHEEPQVQPVLVFPSGGALGITASGGDASGTGGVGGAGGNLLISGWQEVGAGESSFVPTAPQPPTAPITGTTITSTDVAADYPPSGSVGTILIPGAVLTSGAGPTRTITSTFGDIVVSGTLTAGDAAGAPLNLVLAAPNGTVYVTGAILATNSDGTLDGDAAGSVTITAQRIVITGNIQAQGEDHATATGGAGGAVRLDTQSVGGGTGDILFLSPGSIVTTGGASVAPGAATGAVGGDVTILAGGVANVFGSVTADGGSITGTGTATGGTGGAVRIDAKGEIDIVSAVSTKGGNASGSAGTTGGHGGTFLTDSKVVTRVYGSITTQGGTATATSGALTGGIGGDITLGKTNGGGNGAFSLEVGRNTYSTRGGQGTGGGGQAGTIVIRSEYSRVMMGSPLVARGGDATGTTTAPGGNGNSVTILNNSAAHGGAIDESVYVLNTGPIDTSGGAPVGGGAGGSGGTITLTASANIQVLGDLITRGADSAGTGGGAGGDGKDITITSTPTSGTLGNIVLHGPNVDTRGGSSTGIGGGAAGKVTVTASGATSSPIDSTSVYTCTGGDAAGSGAGGAGGTLQFTAAAGSIAFIESINTSGGLAAGSGAGGGAGSITFAATKGNVTLSLSQLTASGGAGSGAGGGAGTITATTTGTGNITLSGNVTAKGGDNLTVPPAAGGSISFTAGSTGGSISSTAIISMLGGSGGAGVLSGGNGGTILFDVTSLSGTVTLGSGSSIQLDGGSVQGVALAGAGGKVTLRTLAQAISISGVIQARGGSGTSGGSGGIGGQVIAISDFNLDGVGGDITLEGFSSIDVSGGPGTVVGGPAISSGGGYAVRFDADEGAGANTSPDGAFVGTVLNNGSIIASGGTGATPGADGQVLFDGKGVSTANPVAGSITPPAAFVAD